MLVKNYLFIDVHKLDGGIRRFDASFEIAESWRRMAFDPENIKSHDLTLLRHELMELRLVSEGIHKTKHMFILLRNTIMLEKAMSIISH